jgi:CBS domain-containing protein
MHVSEVMSSGPDVIGPDRPLVEAAQKMRDDDVGALPVVENDEVIGMITDRDIAVRAVAAGVDLGSAQVRDAMSTEVIWCSPNDPLEEASRIMAQAQVRRLPVMDGELHLLGMVSLGDLSHNEPAEEAAGALRQISEPSQAPRGV